MGYLTQFHATRCDARVSADDLGRVVEYLRKRAGRGAIHQAGIVFGGTNSFLRDLRLEEWHDGGTTPKIRLAAGGFELYAAAQPDGDFHIYRFETGATKWKTNPGVEAATAVFSNLGGELSGFFQGEEAEIWLRDETTPRQSPIITGAGLPGLERATAVRPWLPSHGPTDERAALIEINMLIPKLDPRLQRVGTDVRCGADPQAVIPALFQACGLRIGLFACGDDNPAGLARRVEAVMAAAPDIAICIIGGVPPAALVRQLAAHNDRVVVAAPDAGDEDWRAIQNRPATPPRVFPLGGPPRPSRYDGLAEAPLPDAKAAITAAEARHRFRGGPPPIPLGILSRANQVLTDRSAPMALRLDALCLALAWCNESLANLPWLPYETPEDLLGPFLSLADDAAEGLNIVPKHCKDSLAPSRVQRAIAVWRHHNAPTDLRRKIGRELQSNEQWLPYGARAQLFGT